MLGISENEKCDGMVYNDFTEMSVWKLSMEIVEDVYNLTKDLPKREDYALCSQLRRSAVSIPGNIAGASGGDIQKIK